jgi:hypothetical protein
MTIPSFTRYLYEFHQVEYSLQIAILAKCREEALYWAYELYHSGFKTEVWDWVLDLYADKYEHHNPKLKTYLEKSYLQWKETDDALLLGTVVGTLAILDIDGGKNETKNNKKFIILYKEDRHNTQEVISNPRNYLKQVSQYPIRSEAKYLAKTVCNILPENIREAYLGSNWLYYCADTPIWLHRIKECRGKIVDGRVEFETDDFLEDFYERWGVEPDEQCLEMHQWHGVEL